MTKTLLHALLAVSVGGWAWGGGVASAAETGPSTTSPDTPSQWPLGASPAQGPLPVSPTRAGERGLGPQMPSPTTTGSTGTSGAQTAVPKPASSNETSPTATILNKLHLSNQKEIEMGKVAEKGGQSKDVRNYGKELVKDHTAADKKVAALAKEEHIDLAGAGATTDHIPQPGADFDLKFAQMMVEDHTTAITDVETALGTSSDGKLKDLLGKLLPTLKKHKETAQRIVQSQTAHAEQ